MISGRFFIFDTDVSTNQFSVFRYNRLRKTGNNDLPLREQYPVYLFLDNKHLGFYINTYDDQKYNHELFSFPLLNDPSSDKAISGTLEDIAGSEQFYYELDVNSSKIVSYTEGVGFYALWFRESQNRDDKKLYKDALLLDFLFDFVHTDIFKSNPHWQLLNARIQTNPFLKAILCKGEWLFWSDKYTKNKEHKGSNESQNHISEKRFDADGEWIEIIASDNSPKLFLESGDWFEAAGEEMKRVLYGGNEKISFVNTIKQWKWVKNIKRFKQFVYFAIGLGLLLLFTVMSNFLHFFSFEVASVLPINWQIEIKDFLILTSLIFLILRLFFYKNIDGVFKERQEWLRLHFYNEKNSKKRQRLFDKIRASRNLIYHFFFNRFDFDDGYMWFMRQLSDKKRKRLNYLILFSIINLLISFHVLQFYIDWERLSVLLMFLVIVIVIMMPLMFIIDMQISPNKQTYPSIFHSGLTLPKTSLAMLTGWLVWVPISEEAWKLNANAEWGRIVIWLALMLLLAIVFIFFTLKGIQPELVVGNGLTGSTLGVVLSGYAFAFGWGVLTTQFTCRQALDEPELLVPYVFGKTEQSKSFKEEKTRILNLAVDIEATDTSFKTVNAWKDSVRSFNTKFFKTDSTKIIDVLTLHANKYEIDTIKLITILDTKQEEIISELITQHFKEQKRLPSVVRWKMWVTDWDIYIFPRMLLINSGIAFFLGFFAQIAFQSAGYKEPI
jgi:hypothetical protein